MRQVLIVSSLLLLSACGIVGNASNDSLNGLVINNKTNTSIRDVKLIVAETQGVVACSNIPPLAECSMGFPEMTNKHHHAKLSWKHNGKRYTKPLIGKDSELPHHAQPFQAIIDLSDGGRLDVYLK